MAIFWRVCEGGRIEVGAWRTTFRCDTEDAGQDHNVLTEEGDNGMILGSTTGHCGGLETDVEGGERTRCVIAEAQQHCDSVDGRLEVRGD